MIFFWRIGGLWSISETLKWCRNPSFFRFYPIIPIFFGVLRSCAPRQKAELCSNDHISFKFFLIKTQLKKVVNFQTVKLGCALLNFSKKLSTIVIRGMPHFSSLHFAKLSLNLFQTFRIIPRHFAKKINLEASSKVLESKNKSSPFTWVAAWWKHRLQTRNSKTQNFKSPQSVGRRYWVFERENARDRKSVV